MRRLESIRQEFVANVSHELKTPVTSIRGFAETLVAEADPREARRFADIILRQSDRLERLIDDLLGLARLEHDSSRGRVALEDQPLRETVEAAVHLCEAEAEERRVAIRLACPDAIRARINADLLERAVTNLVDNAVKYSPPESAVDVEVEEREGRVLIRVRDRGCGIASEHLDRIFERFYRVDKARSRAQGGTGLGLSIVKHVAEAHGGTIEVESAVGKGSTFVLSLPG
jgi:two-component system phosphate regulon sensor histidine kinase PhoR